MKKFEDWKVYKNGDIFHKEMNYLIEGIRLQENDWIEHMIDKNWVNLNNFMPAYFQALANINISKINIIRSHKEYFLK